MRNFFMRQKPFWKEHRAELALSLGLFVLALAVRLPNLMLLPRFNEEGQEVLWGLDIALGRRLPLSAGVNPYLGPLFSYLIAVLFRIFGISVELPRLTVAVFGALTVPATYALGRMVWNRLAGLVAAGFVLTCPILILYSSHVGISGALPPFFATATLAAFYAANVKKTTGLLSLSGLLAACTLQTHPITAVILFGMAVWFLSLPELKVRLRQRELYIGLGLFILGCAPTILNLVQAYGLSPKSAQEISNALSPTLAPGEYFSRLVTVSKLDGFFLGGGIGTGTVLLRVEAITLELLLLAALAVSWYRGNRLIPLVLVTSILILAVVLGELSERYIIYLLPAAYVAIGGLVTEILRRLQNARGSRQLALFDGARVATLVLTGGLVFFPLVSLHTYYDEALVSGITNLEYFRLADVVRSNEACGAHLQVEEPLADYSTPMKEQSWFALHAVDVVLTLDRCEHTTLTVSALEQSLAAHDHAGWLIVSEPTHAALSKRFDLDVTTIALLPPIASTVLPVILDRVSP
jgi:4-amino-4-deoxy-L-arabinose transferase-like glycosyltransferase